MRRIPLGVTGVMLAAVGGILAFGGRTLIAADSTRPSSTRTRVTVVPAPMRGVVRVKATGAPVKTSALIVPLRPRGGTSGELMAVNKAGQPLGNCPLKRTDVAADVSGFVARVTVTQKYSNPFKEPIEAVYTFPLPEDAAVDDMEMRIGERVIQGEIKRREEARQIYEQAKAQGQAAALLDQERPNIFTQAVANVMPGQDVTITIRYVNTLKYDEGRYTFAFPMVVGPRYVANAPPRQPGQRGAPMPGQPVPDADKINPPITPKGTRAGHDISLRVNLDAGLVLRDIGSASHDVDVARESETRARVALVNETTIPNKDFILRYTVAGPQMQTGVVAHADGGSGFFTLVLQPPAAPKAAQIAPKEMVFVIDQTGSQMGQPIAKAKETMRHAFTNLNPGDTFQLIGFNTDVYPCFERPVNGTADNIQKATEYLETLDAAGGTDILKAATYALKMPDDPRRLRIICFMTDGYVGNDMQILDFIRNNRGRARVFPFGIGSSVNRFLIEGMAREGRGEAEIVTLDESGPEAAERFYRRVRNPLLLDPRVDWNGLPVEEVFPVNVLDVFSDGPIILKGRFTRAAEGDLTVSGLLAGQPWEQKVHVTFPREQARNAGLESLWARAKVEDLQARDWMGAQSGNPNPQIKEEIVQTALAHRLMSQYTSFVAVEKKVVNQGGKQRTVDVPVEMPEGVSYEGIFGEDSVSLMDATRAPASVSFYSMQPTASRAASSLAAGVMAKPGSPLAEGRKSELESLTRNLPAVVSSPEPVRKLARLTTLRRARMDPRLWDLAAIVQREGTGGSLNRQGRPVVTNGRVRVRITLTDRPADLAAQLKALGFEPATTRENVLTGMIPVEKLDELIALTFVRHVAPA